MSSCECDDMILSLPTLLRYNLALVLLSMATKLIGTLDTKVFITVRREPFLTSMPFGNELSLEKIKASCPMLLVNFKVMKYFRPSPSDPKMKIVTDCLYGWAFWFPIDKNLRAHLVSPRIPGSSFCARWLAENSSFIVSLK